MYRLITFLRRFHAVQYQLFDLIVGRFFCRIALYRDDRKECVADGHFGTAAWLVLFVGENAFYLVDADRDAERGVCFLPDLRVRPVVVLIGPVDNRIECGVNLAAFDDVLRFLVRLVADRFCPSIWFWPCSGSSGPSSTPSTTASVKSVMLLLRLSVKLVTPNGKPSVSSLNENVPFVKSSTTKPE